MVGYATMGTNDLDRSVEFYETLLGPHGCKQIFNTGRLVMFGKEMGDGMFAICQPFNQEPATPGNGTMVAFSMSSKESVDQIYAKALELGAADEGAAGDRAPGFYAGYFRDLDGNKFCAFHMG